MCLGIPGRVVETYRGMTRHGQGRLWRRQQRVCLEHVPEAGGRVSSPRRLRHRGSTRPSAACLPSFSKHEPFDEFRAIKNCEMKRGPPEVERWYCASGGSRPARERTAF